MRRGKVGCTTNEIHREMRSKVKAYQEHAMRARGSKCTWPCVKVGQMVRVRNPRSVLKGRVCGRRL